MKTKLLVLTMLVTLALAVTCHADVPHVISFQGKATDKAGSPLDGTYDITVRIYDHETSGELEWSEAHYNVTIANGIFQVLLGSIEPLGLAFDEDYWLSVEVNTDGEMSPRSRLASVGYAYKAKTSEYATKAGTAENLDTNNIIDAKGGLIIENRTSDPENPETGRIWIRTDL